MAPSQPVYLANSELNVCGIRIGPRPARVAFFLGRNKKSKERCTEKMKRKIDSAVGRVINGMRLAIGEPLFAHLRNVIGLDRFTLRTKSKVDTQWKLFCIVHNLKKIQRFGTGFAECGGPRNGIPRHQQRITINQG